MSIIVNNLDTTKFDFKLVLINGKNRFYPISSSITILDLNASRLLTAIPTLIKVIREEAPDIVFSTLTHLNLFLGMSKVLLPKQTKLIARESSIISINNKYYKYPTLTNKLIKKYYKKFSLIICQSKFMLDDLVDNYDVPTSIMTVINNPINPPKSNLHSKEQNKSKPKFITVGRLYKEKGYDRILKALALLKFDFEYWILGDGSFKDPLTQLIDELGLSNKVTFTGLVKNPFDYLKQSDVFLQGSHFEGFPNAILEATYCGLPVVAYDAPGGTQEILIEGFNGFLVKEDDYQEFANKIEQSLNGSFDSEKITAHTIDKFSLDKIIRAYEDAIMSTQDHPIPEVQIN